MKSNRRQLKTNRTVKDCVWKIPLCDLLPCSNQGLPFCTSFSMITYEAIIIYLIEFSFSWISNTSGGTLFQRRVQSEEMCIWVCFNFRLFSIFDQSFQTIYMHLKRPNVRFYKAWLRFHFKGTPSALDCMQLQGMRCLIIYFSRAHRI